ncbi:MAG: ABC transporter ATP-binding protein [Treponema sp.]|nr:ABC transporter ATP-binding protein [Treponema sp.]
MSASFFIHVGEIFAVRNVSFYLNRNETLAIVGESGCGKTVTVKSIMRINPEPPFKIKEGNILYNDSDIVPLTNKEMQAFRGKEFAMIFQDPMTCLNPTMKVGKQITEGIIKHQKTSFYEAKEIALDTMRICGIADPEKSFNRYPHTYSGGMRQRIMISMALCCKPKILIADEPTTALDVTMQAQILELMNGLKKQTDAGILLITHDLGVVARMADRIAVMYAGEIIETGNSRDVFYSPKHPYTWCLLASMPDATQHKGRELTAIPGAPPDLFMPPPGCAFAARCTHCMPVCKKIPPPEYNFEGNHISRCWLYDARAKKPEPPKIRRKLEEKIA